MVNVNLSSASNPMEKDQSAFRFLKTGGDSYASHAPPLARPLCARTQRDLMCPASQGTESVMLSLCTAALSFSSMAPAPVSRMGASRVSGLAMSDDPWNDDIKAQVTASKSSLQCVPLLHRPLSPVARHRHESPPSLRALLPARSRSPLLSFSDRWPLRTGLRLTPRSTAARRPRTSSRPPRTGTSRLSRSTRTRTRPPSPPR